MEKHDEKRLIKAVENSDLETDEAIELIENKETRREELKTQIEQLQQLADETGIDLEL